MALILQLSGVNIGRIFSTRGEKNISDDEKLFTENIHEIPFESEIKQAIANKNYKLATRLLYLQSLKLLSDKKLIVWTEQKTNRQYEYEIKDHNIRNHFITITTVFEIVCYGERSLNDDKFLQVHQLFNRFKTQLV